MNRIFARTALPALPALLLTGCLMGPDWERPDVSADLPESFRVPADEALLAPAPDGGSGISEASYAQGDTAGWFGRWNDATLQSLLARAAQSNLTVRQAAERVVAARASLDSARASLWPTLGASGSATRTRTFDPSDTSTGYRAGADAAWELDLFGKNRRAAEAGEADLEAAGWSLDNALLSLRAETVSAYVALRLAQTSLSIARLDLQSELDNAEIARAKGRSGFTSGADVAAAEAAIATAQAAIPPREAAADRAARALERLLALPPGALDEELVAPAAVAGDAATATDAATPEIVIPLPPPVADVAPAQVLERRPDVRAALAALHAATARVGEARAARFPSVNLAGSLTLSASSLSAWSEAVKALSGGPSLSVPIFRGGALAAAERRADSAAREALLAYRDAVLAAVHEAQNAWTALDAESRRGEDLERAVQRDAEALEAARARYRAGTGDWTAVTVRQGALLSARMALAQHRADIAECAITLVKALGGAL